MNIADILKGALNVAGVLHPGIGAAITAVNAFLPDDEKLPETATGQDVQSAINTLPAEQQAQVMAKEIQLEIAREEGWTDRYKAMCEGDGQSTRPRIALMMAWLVCVSTTLLVVVLGYGVHKSGLSSLTDASAGIIGLFGILTAIPASVLGKYFGELRKEQNARLGFEPAPLINKLLRK